MISENASSTANANPSLATIPMSAYGYERKFRAVGQHVCFAPDSRHSNADVCFPADYVCLTPNSRRKWARRWRSAYDPKPSSIAFACWGTRSRNQHNVREKQR